MPLHMHFKEEASEPGFSVSFFEVGVLLMAESTRDCCGSENGLCGDWRI